MAKIISIESKNQLEEEERVLSALTGPLRGRAIILGKIRHVIGRSKQCEVFIDDDSCSREHAEITWNGEGHFVTDMKSHNGIVVNGEKITQTKLEIGDKVIVGKTVFHYTTLAPDTPSSEVSRQKKGKDEVKRKNSILIPGFLLVAAFLYFLPSEEVKRKSSVKKESQGISLRPLGRKEQSSDENQKKIDELLHRGQRELREGNYYRAMSEFNLALVIGPNHPRAGFYLEKAKQALAREVEKSLKRGEQEVQSLKFSSAKVSFCEVLKLLENNINDERYQSAEEKIKDINLKLGLLEEQDCR